MTQAERRGADTRERLLQAAHERLATDGYAGLQVADIARAAGVATGSVYRHFPSKAELVAAVFRRAVDPELAAVAAAAAPGRPATERLAGGVEAFVLRALAALRRATALLAEPVDPVLDVLRHDYRRAYQEIFTAAIADGIAAGELERCDAELAGAAIVGALGEALLGPLATRRTLEPAAVVSGLTTFVLSAVAPRRVSVHA